MCEEGRTLRTVIVVTGAYPSTATLTTRRELVAEELMKIVVSTVFH